MNFVLASTFFIGKTQKHWH